MKASSSWKNQCYRKRKCEDVYVFVACTLKQNKTKEWPELYTWLLQKVIIVALDEPSVNPFMSSPRC